MNESQTAKVTQGRQDLAIRQGGFHGEWGWAAPCWWCKWWFPLFRLTREHLVRKADVPISERYETFKGQQHIVLACAPCNNRRHASPANRRRAAARDALREARQAFNPPRQKNP